ncbi:amino acid adenylation domain-containing protein [Embleya sp. NPDC059237]|uniref:non-ribosomal peptide synthetase n=1 Tax=Embleya sp. NPDC059237 TaxID=3346784 RepID=UPI0036B80B68
MQRLRETQVAQFLGRAVSRPPDRTVLDLVEDWASRAPHAPAVECAGRVLDYERMTRMASALARDLHEHGAGPGDLIPLAARNGLGLPVAMLAVLKTGAAFVPLDATWPEQRLHGMIRACDPKVVLSVAGPDTERDTGAGTARDTGAGTSRDARPTWGDDSDAPVTLAVDLDRLGAPTADRFGPPARPDNLAYGFYTSGSTGVPKCALNTHRGLLNRFLYMTRRFVTDDPERVLQNSRHTFDSSLWQLLWPLTHGGSVVIPEPRGMLDLAATVDVIARHRITMTDFVPTIFNSLVELLHSQPELVPRLGSLRRLLIGGEEINARAVRLFHEMLPDVALINTYGPTEAAIGSVFHDVTRDRRSPLPIGRPIDNTWAIVLDEHNRPVAPGEIGEIHIGGECLGLGYLGDPQRTDAAFVANPFTELPGSRMYRTGDLGHHDADGVLFFGGRRDQQFKVGGVRVESGEVEQAIATHPGVREAKVVAHEHGGSTYLAAFVTVGRDTSTDDLIRHARATLPAELTPKRFVILENMPLNGNGKADRGALKRLLDRPAQAGAPAAPVPPGTAGGATRPLSTAEHARQALLDLWAEVLPEPVVHADKDFFDSGGDSLSAQRLALAIAARFRTRFSVRDVVAAPTVTDQLAALRGRTGPNGNGNGGGTGASTAARRTRPGPAEHFGHDPVLPPDIRLPYAPPEPRVEHVLLTGVTGFVGAQLLYDVLRLPGVAAYCLVRADDAESARRRVADNLRHYGLWRDEHAERLRVVVGDLSAPGLGLDDADARRLAERVDTIVHAGALVNLVRGYSAHRPANVEGTVEILRFATRCRPKALHFVSTLAARGRAPVPDGPGSRAPEAPWPAADAATTGYGRSKWVAERLVLQAAERGLPTAVHRLGEVMPATDTGVPNTGSRTDLFIRACLRVGGYPTNPLLLDYTPLDTVGALLAAAVAHHERGWFHLLHPTPVQLGGLLGAFGAAFGLEPVGYETFWAALHDASLAAPGDRTLAGALAVLPAPDGDPQPHQNRLADVFQDGTALFSVTRAERLARRIGLRPPVIDANVFDRYVHYHRMSTRS